MKITQLELLEAFDQKLDKEIKEIEEAYQKIAELREKQRTVRQQIAEQRMTGIEHGTSAAVDGNGSPKRKKTWTPAQIEAQQQRMREIWARRKQADAAPPPAAVKPAATRQKRKR